MKYYCNPLNIEYRYQYVRSIQKESQSVPARVFREAADPSLVLFKNRYYMFVSVAAGFLVSDNLVDWEYHKLPDNLPAYDYAPDVCVAGEYLYFSASRREENCSFFRTKNPITEPFEEIKGTFPFWDPHLFQDDNEKLYFYWGCSNTEPIYGVEMNVDNMVPKTGPKELIAAKDKIRGYERCGEDHVAPRTQSEIEQQLQIWLEDEKKEQRDLPEDKRLPDEMLADRLRGYLSNDPYIEGPWMTKYQNKYYLQYAVTGTEYNVYADGVYVSENPLGPFKPAKNNPYSYNPGGFMTGAGHGSTVKDKNGQFWHTATMRISKNHIFERRVGLWKAAFDKDGELYCNQRYADWPIRMDASVSENPDWMLLSYGKKTVVSSGLGAEFITDENARTWWKANSSKPGEWAEVDLGAVYDVRAIQINFADDEIMQNIPKDASSYKYLEERYIDSDKQFTRWRMEGSLDGKQYDTITDKWDVDADLPHDFLLYEKGLEIRYIRLSIREVPYEQKPCVSGIRIFGNGNGKPPSKVEQVKFRYAGKMDLEVSWKSTDATGYNILWGYAPDKLYHNYRLHSKTCQHIRALIEGEPVYVRVDAFGESGITEGDIEAVKIGETLT